MQAIPLRVSDTEFDLFVILEDFNIERIRAYDPAEVVKAYMGNYASLQIRNIVIAYATDADLASVHQLIRNGDARGALQHLCRGWAYHPERGDKNGEYEALFDSGHKPGKPPKGEPWQ